ncbi:MAG: Uncharacterised protein [Halieaceae bacterium]|nr:MAG: Uncharacterised protein [Halieaceae bacterium]
MYGCVFASTSGLIRTDMGATLPSRSANRSINKSSDVDSTLKQRIPAVSACSISDAALPTPEKTIFSASPPAWSTLCNSPPETISKPDPIEASSLSIAIFELALTA